MRERAGDDGTWTAEGRAERILQRYSAVHTAVVWELSIRGDDVEMTTRNVPESIAQRMAGARSLRIVVEIVD